ncbi:MAG: hypothetical protein ACOVOT_17315 [Rubrivivax sp.]|jgi:hypothetical protein|nr:hypothetical protein [Rubrivivax sp.]
MNRQPRLFRRPVPYLRWREVCIGLIQSSGGGYVDTEFDIERALENEGGEQLTDFGDTEVMPLGPVGPSDPNPYSH